MDDLLFTPLYSSENKREPTMVQVAISRAKCQAEVLNLLHALIHVHSALDGCFYFSTG